MRAARQLAPPSDLEATLIFHLRAAGLDHGMEREYQFHPGRRWRFDLAWPARKVAVEVQGGVWSTGKHSRGAGVEKDHEKNNAAQLDGWTVLQYSHKPITDGRALTGIEAALRGTRRGVSR